LVAAKETSGVTSLLAGTLEHVEKSSNSIKGSSKKQILVVRVEEMEEQEKEPAEPY